MVNEVEEAARDRSFEYNGSDGSKPPSDKADLGNKGHGRFYYTVDYCNFILVFRCRKTEYLVLKPMC
jgi:hypothetical protein